MEEIDLTKCLPGDELISIHGVTFIYCKKAETPYPHWIVLKGTNRRTSRADNGQEHLASLPCDHDIVKVIRHGVVLQENKEPKR
jgi:hypothetical protein